MGVDRETGNLWETAGFGVGETSYNTHSWWNQFLVVNSV